MNKSYRLIWSDIQNTWIAVSEITTARGKRNSAIAMNVSLNTSALYARFLLKPLCATILLTRLADAAPGVNELPAGGQVSAGQASISQSGNVMNINQGSSRAAINWQSFNVGSQASVNFHQPDGNSVTLNRVDGGNPSQIYGQINANGKVFLTNSSGIYFAPGASVNVGGLVATTHRISDDDFMAGRYKFDRNGATGSVINDGTLNTNDLNGYIALLAPEVRNNGVIVAQMGTVVLAAGEAFELQFDGSHSLASIRVEPSTIKALVENHNAVQAPGGLIILSAQAANDLQGGVINHSGSLEASSLTEKGGRIILEGDDITLATSSEINATGATGGGEVLVGGDWQGSGDIYQATTVSMEQGSSIDASATQNGDGGKVVLWSDINNTNSQTRVAGKILANGGANGGDGGQIETSGHVADTTGAYVSAAAPQGSGGLWLIDPANDVITQAIADGYTTTLNSGTSVTNSVTGNITTSGNVNITKTNGGDATLTFEATGYIALVDASLYIGTTSTNPADGSSFNISSTSGKLNVVMNPGSAGGLGGFWLPTGSSINTNGGDITIGGEAGAGSYATGVFVSSYETNSLLRGVAINGALNAQGGNITIRGKGSTASGVTAARGVHIGDTVQTSGIGTIFIDGIADGSSDGLAIDGGVISAENGTITLSGTKATGTRGINLTNSGRIETTGTGNLLVTSTGNFAGTNGNLLIGGTTGITASGFDVSLNNASNNFTGAITVTGANVSLRDTNALTLGSSTVSGNLTLQTGGALTQTGALAVSGTTGITAGSANHITLTNSGNNFTGAVSILSGNNVSLRDANALSLGASTISGNLTLQAGGALTQVGDLAVSGATGITAGSANDITLDNSGNNFTGAVSIVSGNNVSLRDANALSLGASTISGNLTLQTGGALTQVGALAVSGTTGITAGAANNITLDNSGNNFTGAVSIFSGNNVSLRDANALSLGSSTVTGDFILTASGAVTQNAAITSTGLLLVGTGSSASFNLTNSGNVVSTLAADPASFTYYNNGALTIGTVGGVNGITANGPVDIGTFTGDLIVNQNISTTDTSSSAIVLNAGINEVPGTTTGGNIIISGSPSLTTGTGGSVRLYTGSIANSTGLAAMASSGSESYYRYHADETTNFASGDWLNLGSGTYVIYREQPSITVTVDNKVIIYGDTLPTYTFSVDSQNGDTAVQIFSSLPSVNVSGSTSTSGNFIAGDHSLAASGGTEQLGYAISGYTDGTLAISQRPITITANSGQSKVYGDSDPALTYMLEANSIGRGLVTGDSFGGALARTNGENVGSYAINQGTLDNNNYDINFVSDNFAITPAHLVVTANAKSKIYDGLAYSGGNGVSYSGFVNGDDSSVLSGSLSYSGSSQGAVNAGSYVISPGGLMSNNYALSFVDSALSINPAGLTVTAIDALKTFNGVAYAGGNGVNFSGFVNGENSSILTGSLAYGGSSQGAINVGSYAITPSGLSSNNYTISFVDGTLSIINATPRITQGLFDTSVNAQALGGNPSSGVIVAEPVPLIQTSTDNLNNFTDSGSVNGGPVLLMLKGDSVAISENVDGGFISVRSFDEILAPINEAFKFVLPDDTFIHSDSASALKLTASLNDGQALPNWLNFDPASGQFTGEAPANVVSITVRVEATDQQGKNASTTIVLRFEHTGTSI